MSYEIIKGLSSPAPSHPLQRTSLDDLVTLAKRMEVGDAVHLTPSGAQTFRIILIALGFCCEFDTLRNKEHGMILVFKLPPDFR